MQISKISSFYNLRNQTNSTRNQQPSYMYRANSNTMGDSVSFGINLQPKILSPKLNELFGEALTKLAAQEKAITSPIIDAIQSQLNRTDVKFTLDKQLMNIVHNSVKDVTVPKVLADGTVLEVSKGVSKEVEQMVKPRYAVAKDPLDQSSIDYILIKATKDGVMTKIKIQDNCLERLIQKGTSALKNEAFISKEILPLQKGQIRTGANIEEISKYGESAKLNDYEAEIINFLEKYLVD